MKLIIVLLVLGLRRLDIDWPSWLRENPLRSGFQSADGSAEGAEWLLKVFLPALLVGVVMVWLHHILWGLPTLVLGLLLLLWVLGVDSEFRQFDELLVRARMNDTEQFAELANVHFGVAIEPGSPGYYRTLTHAISQREVTRLFVMLFYVITLGYGFVLFYALNFWLAEREQDANSWARRWHEAMLWLPVRLLVLALAIGGDFRRVMEAVDGKIWQASGGSELFAQALDAARDVDELDDAAAPGEAVEMLEDLQSLQLRVLAIWMIFAALWTVLAI